MKPRGFKKIDPNTVVLLKRIFSGVIIISIVALLITAVWYSTRIHSLTLQTVIVHGGETINPAAIQKIAEQELEGLYIGLVPRRFAWTYPQDAIHDSLRAIDRIHNISIDRRGGTELIISFEEYVPHSLWCSGGEKTSCAFMDATGYAFAPAPNLTGGSFLRFIAIGDSYQLRTEIMDPAVFAQLVQFASLLRETGWYVSSIEFDQVGDAFISIVGGGELKITLSQTPEDTIDNLQTVLSSEEFTYIAPGNFQYIDLRFGNKVFINEELLKEKNATSSEKVASSTEAISHDSGHAN